MIFKRKHRGPMISSSCDHPALRMLLLMGIFAMTASAYWWHFDRRMAQLAPPDGSYSVSDMDKLLTKEDEKRLYTWRSAFKETWGIDVFVMVTAGPLTLPEFPGSTLFVGLGREQSEALIVLPPLAKKALGEAVRLTTEENLALCLKKDMTPAAKPEQEAPAQVITHEANAETAPDMNADTHTEPIVRPTDRFAVNTTVESASEPVSKPVSAPVNGSHNTGDEMQANRTHIDSAHMTRCLDTALQSLWDNF